MHDVLCPEGVCEAVERAYRQQSVLAVDECPVCGHVGTLWHNVLGCYVGAAASQSGASEQELEAIAGYWQCRQCTTANTDLSSTVCEVCGNAKAAAA